MKLPNFSILYLLIPLLTVSVLAGCSQGDALHTLYEAVLLTDEHKALVKNPKSLDGQFFEAKATQDVMGSVSFDDAINCQNADQMPTDKFIAKYRQKTNFDDFKARNVLLSEGRNAEDAKANVLLKVLNGQSVGERQTAVEVLVLNKKFAGQKFWIGSEIFLARATKTACPINDPTMLEFGTETKPETKQHARSSAKTKHSR